MIGNNKTKINSEQGPQAAICIYGYVDMDWKRWYHTNMINFTETTNGYVFTNSEQAFALGIYENGNFILLHNDEMLTFGNAMSAFSHLRSLYEPKEASPKTLELFTKPSRPIDNMSKYRDNPNLINMPKEVFHANLPS